jgi:aspartyl-tRNA(Asn)/glutamyl-tRNA(Gln) amidotransferase subunit A
MELYTLTIFEAHQYLKEKKCSSVELVTSVLKRINEVDGNIRAYITVSEKEALVQAAQADKQIAQGNGTYLTGIPISVKDLICTKNIRTTCASKMLENFISPYDATVIEKLNAAGAVMIGKTNLDEFAMGTTTENSAFFPTHNPWHLEHVPGGSSGGSAASVAADMCLGSLGSDTGGSIRQPASYCGVVGIKPTYGRVSRYGATAFASSLDQIGSLGKTVWDTAAILNVIAGFDSKDSTSSKNPVPDYTKAIEKPLAGKRIGIPKEYAHNDQLHPEVRTQVEAAIRELVRLGATCVDISLPHSPYAAAVYCVIAPCEASSNLSRYDGIQYGYRSKEGASLLDLYEKTRTEAFGPEVKRRILIGTCALSSGYYDAYYRKAALVRTKICQDFDQAFTQCDLIATPVAPSPAPRLGEKANPLTMYLQDEFILPANLTGLPAISIPCGISSAGLPIGFQLMAPHFKEEELFAVAGQFEKNTSHHTQKPLL